VKSSLNISYELSWVAFINVGDGLLELMTAVSNHVHISQMSLEYRLNCLDVFNKHMHCTHALAHAGKINLLTNIPPDITP
jgi:hypothetical protein